MANINQINESAQSMGSKVQQKPKGPEKTGAFDNLLNTALDKAEPAEGGPAVSSLGEISAPRFDLQTPASIVTGKTDALLGLMDTYVAQLGNPGVSLKSMAPVIEQMNHDADALMKEAKFLDTGETGLKEIATQTAVAARTEYVKFQRGDYLS